MKPPKTEEAFEQPTDLLYWSS